MMPYYYLITFLVPLLATAMLVLAVKKNALKFGFVDMPAARKVHASPVPLGGGVAVFLGVVFSIITAVAFLDFNLPRTIVGYFAGAMLLVLVGFLDDILDLDFVTKLFGQVVSAMIFLAFLERTLPVFSAPVNIAVSILWIVSLSNALNFLDNMDGLCSGITLITAGAFGILFLMKGMPVYAILSFSIVGAALGFLRYNLSPASIFLGDAGSLFFGYSLACLAVVHFHTNSSMSVAGALSPVIILAYPVFDLIFVTYSRLREGRKLYIGGKDHSSHKLNVLGVTKRRTVFIIMMINLFMAVLGIVLFLFENSPILTLFIIVFTVSFSFFGAHLYKNFIFIKEKLTLGLADLLSVNFAFIIYYFFKKLAAGTQYSDMPVNELVVALAWINAFWIVLYAVVGLYDKPFEFKFRTQFKALIKAIILGFLIFFLANYKPQEEMEISLAFISLFLLILLIINSLIRFLIHLILRKKCFSGNGKLNALIACASNASSKTETIKFFGKYYNILGYAGNAEYGGLEYLGSPDDLNDILRKNKIARIIIDCGERDYREVSDVFASAYYMETSFLVKGRDEDNKRGFKLFKTGLEDIHIASIRHRGLIPIIVKRLFDITISAAVLILISPYIFASVMVLRSRKKRAISDLQIIIQGEKIGNMKVQPSIRQSGGYRNWRSLLSVLKGEICIYGSTITPVKEYKTNMNSIPGYWRKFLVKPGLFGPGYSGKSSEERFRLDLAYMEKTSTFADFGMALKQIVGLPAIKLKEVKND